MKGQKSPTLGTADFRHPERTDNDFDETIDDFTLASMALSLKAISLKPELANKYGTTDKLLFSEDDYRDIAHSFVLKELLELLGDKELARLYALFLLAHSKKNLSSVSFRDFLIEKPEEEILSTEVTDEDLAEAIIDEYGVKYSKDGKRLLKAPDNIERYMVREGTKIICDCAFSYYNPIKSITIPDSLTMIGQRAFCGCKSLQTITLPSSLRNINGNPFAGLRLNIINHSQRFHVEDGILYTADKKKLISCVSSDEEIIIPDGVTSIGPWAFYKCVSLKTINLPNNLTEIGDDAFGDCSSLELITIPNSVTSIGNKAFSLCCSLESITVPNRVTTIRDGAFHGCTSLETINLPEGLTTIENRAFSSCKSLKTITLPSSLRDINGNPFPGLRLNIINHSQRFHVEDGILYTADMKKLISCVSSNEDIVIPVGVITIGEMAFYERITLKSINLLKGVITIKELAFSGCSSLESVNLPEGLTTIENRAFSSCKSLKTITIPDGVTTIGNHAFFGCESLETITIPDGVTTIEQGAFFGCESLETITIPDGVTTIGNRAFLKCRSLKSIALPNNLTTIGRTAFLGCKSLESITLPPSLRNINGNPFPGLKLNVVNHSPYFHIQDGILYTADKKKLIFCVSSNEEIVIPDGVITIGERAFSYCDSIKSIKIPKSVISVENGAFRGCSSLKSITIPNKEAKMDNCGLCTSCNLDEETIKELRKICKKTT